MNDIEAGELYFNNFVVNIIISMIISWRTQSLCNLQYLKNGENISFLLFVP